jgi:hypothetical protein
MYYRFEKTLLHSVGASSPTSGEKGKIKSVNSSNGRNNKVSPFYDCILRRAPETWNNLEN